MQPHVAPSKHHHVAVYTTSGYQAIVGESLNTTETVDILIPISPNWIA